MSLELHIKKVPVPEETRYIEFVFLASVFRHFSLSFFFYFDIDAAGDMCLHLPALYSEYK